MSFIKMGLIFVLVTGAFVFNVPRYTLANWDGRRLTALKLLERVKTEGTVQTKIDYGHAKIEEIKAKRVFYLAVFTSVLMLVLNIILICSYLRAR